MQPIVTQTTKLSRCVFSPRGRNGTREARKLGKSQGRGFSEYLPAFRVSALVALPCFPKILYNEADEKQIRCHCDWRRTQWSYYRRIPGESRSQSSGFGTQASGRRGCRHRGSLSRVQVRGVLLCS